MSRFSLQLSPPFALAGELPRFETAPQLAAWFGIEPGELNWFAWLDRGESRNIREKLRHYRCRWAPRKRRPPRLIEAPKPRLKELQRMLVHDLLAHIPVHPSAGAFRRGKSMIDCLRPHAGRRFVMTLDLCDFFPSIAYSRVMGLFRTVGYPAGIARLLAGICTHVTPLAILETGIDRLRQPARWNRFRDRHLPQGAPTSPVLANLCSFHLDRRLTGLAKQFGATYSRYADDLIFSGGDDLRKSQSRLRTWALAILIDEGHALQNRKSRAMSAGESQRVCGLTLNEKPNIDRKECDRLKAILFNCVRHGPAFQNRENHPDFRAHLRGRIAWVMQVHPDRGAKLLRLFEQIVWV